MAKISDELAAKILSEWQKDPTNVTQKRGLISEFWKSTQYWTLRGVIHAILESDDFDTWFAGDVNLNRQEEMRIREERERQSESEATAA